MDFANVDFLRTIAIASLCALMLAIPTAHAGSDRSIAGDYVCRSGCRLTDAPPSIRIEGHLAHCMNEFGGTFEGTLLDPATVACFNKIGRLSQDGATIVWSNGAIWGRAR